MTRCKWNLRKSCTMRGWIGYISKPRYKHITSNDHYLCLLIWHKIQTRMCIKSKVYKKVFSPKSIPSKYQYHLNHMKTFIPLLLLLSLLFFHGSTNSCLWIRRIVIKWYISEGEVLWLNIHREIIRPIIKYYTCA